MGIDYVTLQGILKSLKYVDKKDRCLTLGRQQFHLGLEQLKQLLQEYSMFDLIDENKEKNYLYSYCENFFTDIGFNKVLSIDNSNYENANIIFNLNLPIISNEEVSKFNFILDGGTTEHIFNQVQLNENIMNLLSVGGIYCTVTCNNNFSGHGMYQFSPEFFLSVYNETYGMKLLELYLAKNNTSSVEWIDVRSHNGWRNMSKFENNNEQVYIIAIIQKISNERKSLLDYPPNQYSYEEVDWKKK
jgi:hypothetical protein